MTTNNDTPPNVDTPDDDEQVKNPGALLCRNRELMAELKAAQAELKTAQEAQQTTLADVTKWRDRWYRVAVEEPLDAQLSKAATVPVKYIKDLCMEHGLLLRPRWYTVKGEPDDAPHAGVSGHPVRALYDLGMGSKGGLREPWAIELSKAMHLPRGSGALGSSTNSYLPRAKQDTAPVPAPVQGPALGLR